ncbi:MAG: DUF1015 family protein [Pelobium sp.]
MPVIKPFHAILPSADKVDRVVINLENLSLKSAKEVRAINEDSFVHLLIPKIENYYLRGSKQELAFQKIAENFEDFINQGILLKDKEPAIYIYQQEKEGKSYTGIWTVSSIDDYINNSIKKHELTRPERERGLIEYLQQTGIDANPVLITYPPHQELELIICSVLTNAPSLDFTQDKVNHRIWKVNEEEKMDKICELFSQMKQSYIADGHHRAAAASTFGIERRKLNLKHQGNEEYNFFSSVYISANQLEILPFHRFIKLDTLIADEAILSFIKENFEIQEIEKEALIPTKAHYLGLYFNHKSYSINLNVKLKNEVLHDLDVSLLQHYLLEPMFGMNNPREDKRLNFIGGEIALNQHLKEIDKGIYDLAFFLYPTAIDDLMKIADLGETMPPKSTWFEPKFPAGLITHEIK